MSIFVEEYLKYYEYMQWEDCELGQIQLGLSFC